MIKNILLSVLIVAIVLVSGNTSVMGSHSGPVPAFPGAEGAGAGAFSSGYDRQALNVIQVTNLDNSGTGSLRDAIENQTTAGELDVIVFTVGGTIELGSPGDIRFGVDGIYVAGQTAPGGGIAITGNPKVFSFDRDGTAHDIVIRYIRARSPKSTPGGQDVISIGGGHDIILDHVSMQWGNDEVFSVVTNTTASGGTETYNITLQYSFVAEGLRSHSTGGLIGFQQHWDGTHPLTHDIDYHHNIFVHNAHRNPQAQGVEGFRFTNNLVYNWRNRIGATWRGSEADWTNNFYTMGPWDQGKDRWLAHAPCRNSGDDSWTETPSIYISGNHFDTDGASTVPNADQWSFIWIGQNCIDPTRTEDTELPTAWQRGTPLADPPFPVTLQSAVNARTSLLNKNVGMWRRLDGAGQWVDVQDAVDADIIDHIINGTGPSTDDEADDPDDYGGFPTIETPGTPYTDTDGDSMGDAWETANGLDPNDASDAANDAGTGWTNLEHFLNGDTLQGGYAFWWKAS